MFGLVESVCSLQHFESGLRKTYSPAHRDSNLAQNARTEPWPIPAGREFRSDDGGVGVSRLRILPQIMLLPALREPHRRTVARVGEALHGLDGQSVQYKGRRPARILRWRVFRPEAGTSKAATRQVELRDRQFVQPASYCMNPTAYLSLNGAIRM